MNRMVKWTASIQFLLMKRFSKFMFYIIDYRTCFGFIYYLFNWWKNVNLQGTRIQAIISKYVLSAHQDKIKEGEHYYITRFKVTENIGDYKATKHNHKIIFLKNSVIRNCNDITIPADRFNFANFNDILALKYDTTVLTGLPTILIHWTDCKTLNSLNIYLLLLLYRHNCRSNCI